MPNNPALITVKAILPSALRIVPSLTPEKVQAMARACQERHKVRDGLLILTLF